jgi:hypothetical protein
MAANLTHQLHVKIYLSLAALISSLDMDEMAYSTENINWTLSGFFLRGSDEVLLVEVLLEGISVYSGQLFCKFTP